VAGPEDPHLVVDAMEPVIGEVIGEEEQHVGSPLVQIVVARVLEREQLDDEQQYEGRDRVEDQLRHGPQSNA
jgi:hypothetical protein